MTTYSVIFAPEAEDDLIELYDYIAMQDGFNRAFDYIERIRLFCIGLASFPGRAARRDDLRPGLRTVGFERRVTIAFHVTPGLVVIDRISYGGRNVETLLDGA